VKAKKIAAIVTALTMTVSMLGGLARPASAANNTPELTAESTILGLADTGNKSTLKYELIKEGGPGDTNLYYYNEAGERVIYENQETAHIRMEPVKYDGKAVLKLTGGDASKLDISSAKVELQDSNTTLAKEIILNTDKTKLVKAADGVIEFTLSEGALEWNTWDYYNGMAEKDIDLNSGREWSMMGGDGNGVYEFIFKVSGIRYDGEDLAPVTFRGYVYIYGRSSTDLGLGTEFVPNTYDVKYTSGKSQTSETQWSWHTEGEESAKDKPYMNDKFSDYFSVTWPAGTDASSITAKDVTVTLRSQYGDEYVLSEKNAYGEQELAVVANKGETEIIVTYQQWAYIPVYSEMEITVDKGDLKASRTYEISSVAAWGAQTGGGGTTVEHTVVVQNYNGLTGLTLKNAANTTYTLKTEKDGVTYYYVEKDGIGSLAEGVSVPGGWGGMMITSAPDGAWKGDATELYHVAVHENCLFYETPAEAKTEVKKVDGEDISFTVEFSAAVQASEMVARGAKLAKGYNLYNNGADKWPWSTRYQVGWNLYTEKPTDLPYYDLTKGMTFGYDPAEGSNPAYDEELSNPSTSGPGGMGGPGGPGVGGPDTAGPNAGGPDAGGPNVGGPNVGGPNTNGPGTSEEISLEGTYTSSGLTLILDADGVFTASYEGKSYKGTYTSQSKFNFFTKQTSTIVILDEASLMALAGAGALPAWYSQITPNKEDGSFTIAKDVSMALISDHSLYTIRTEKDAGSKTGYTTTITVKDGGYSKVDAFGDWIAVDASGEMHGPDTWAAGMEYTTSSVLPLAKDGESWTLKVPLASSAMGVIAYHDALDEDLNPDSLKPLKITFDVPYDAAKQAPSTDWTPAFPASETGVTAGKLDVDVTVITKDGQELAVSIQTPAGYDANRNEPYPVVYLIPGGGSDYKAWFTSGMVGNVFDNLTADGRVVPTILVSMERTDVNGDNGRSYLNEIIAYVETNYNACTDAAYRSLVGVSMGSVAATQLWLANPDQFAYYGFLSGADRSTFNVLVNLDDETEETISKYEDLSDARIAQLSKATYFLAGGTTDFNMYTGDQSSASVTELDTWMDHYGIPHNEFTDDEGYQVTAGDHNWPIWMKLMVVYAENYLWKAETKVPAEESKPVDPQPEKPTEAPPAQPVDAQPVEPSTAGSKATTYIVMKGDSLWAIAQKFYGTGEDWIIIYEANRDVIQNSDMIYVGQELKIPVK